MSDLLIKFISPYIASLQGAAYNVQQTVEGAGIGSSNFIVRDAGGHITGSYWSPHEAMYLPLGALLLYCLLLLLAYCTAGYALSRKKGLVLAWLALSIPGVISASGYWPQVNFMPEVYRIGSTGSLGSPYGMAALTIIALLSGWTCVVIATDLFGLQERFRHFYDHLWYSMAILAGVFFVADAGNQEEMRDLQDTTKHVQQASSYLLGQVREYAKFCKAASIEQKASCIWANEVQQNLVDYAVYDERLYWQLGPKSVGDLYSPLQREERESAIRSELKQFNQLQCPASPGQFAAPSNTCQTPPAAFCTGVDDADYMVRTVALSNECVIPTLVRLRTEMVRQIAHTKAAARAKHTRWLFYLLVAFLAGGKVGNATAKFTKVQSGGTGLGDERNIRSLLGTAWRTVRFVGGPIVVIFRWGLWLMGWGISITRSLSMRALAKVMR